MLQVCIFRVGRGQDPLVEKPYVLSLVHVHVSALRLLGLLVSGYLWTGRLPDTGLVAGQNVYVCWVPMADSCNPSYLGD
jgi:hypothetical protein